MKRHRNCRNCNWPLPRFVFSCPGCGHVFKPKARAAAIYLGLLLAIGFVIGALFLVMSM